MTSPQHLLTVHPKDTTLTERQITDLAAEYFGELIPGVGIEDDWMVVFNDFRHFDLNEWVSAKASMTAFIAALDTFARVE